MMAAPAHRQRRLSVLSLIVAVVAGITAIVGFVGARNERPIPDDTARHAVLAAAEDAVGALMTFGPNLDAAGRDTVAQRLTGGLLLRYRSEGVDVVLPTAEETGASMSVQVVGVGLDSYADDQAQVLVFADQTIRIPALTQSDARQADSDGRTTIARWATMRKVDGMWRLAGLDVVGDATR